MMDQDELRDTTQEVTKKVTTSAGKSTRRRVLRILQWSIATPVFLIMGLYVILVIVVGMINTDVVNAWLTDVASGLLEGSVSVERIYVFPFTGRLRVEGLELKDADGKLVVGPASLTLGWNTTHLLRKIVTIQSLRLDADKVVIEQAADGSINLLSLFPLGAEPAPETRTDDSAFSLVNFRIDQMEIRIKTLEYRLEEPRLTVLLADLSLDSTVNLVKETGTIIASFGASRVIRHDMPDLTVRQFSLDGSYVGGLIDVGHLSVETGQSTMSMNGRVSLTEEGPILEKSELAATLDLAEFAPQLRLLAKDYNGVVSFTINAHGTLAEPEAVASLSAKKLIVAGIPLSSAQLDSFLERKDSARLTGLLKTADGNSLAITAKSALPADWLSDITDDTDSPNATDWNTTRHEATVKIAIADVATLNRFLASPLPLTVKKVTTSLDWNGQGVDPDALQGTFTLTGESWIGRDRPSFQQSLQLSGSIQKQVLSGKLSARINPLQGISLTDSEVDGRRLTRELLTLNTNVTYGLKTALLKTDGSLLVTDLKPIVAMFTEQDVNGRIELDWRGEYGPDNVAFDGQLTAASIETAGVVLNTLSVPLSLQGAKLVFEGVNATSGDSSLNISGSVTVFTNRPPALAAEPTIDLVFQAEKLNPVDFYPQSPATATLSLSGTLTGPLSAPSAHVNLVADDIVTEWQTFETVIADVRLEEGNRLIIERGEITLREGEKLALTGEYDIAKGEYDARASLPKLSLSSLSAMEGVDLTGTIALNAVARGSIDAPSLTADIALTEVSFQSNPVPDFAGKVSLVGTKAELELRTADESLVLNGLADLDTSFADLTLQMRNPPLAPFLAMADIAAEVQDLRGNVSLKIPWKEWRKLDGRISVEGLALTIDENAVNLFEPVDIVITGGNVDVRNVQITAAEQLISIGGTIDLVREKLDLRIRGNVDYAMLPSLIEDFPESGGRIGLDMSVAGTMVKPEVTGSLTLENVSMEIPGIENRLNSVNGTIMLVPGKISLSSLEGKLDDGRISISGSMGLAEDFSPTDIDITFIGNLLPITIANTMEMRLNVDAKWRGAWTQSLISGTVNLQKGVYYKDVDMNPAQLLQESEIVVSTEPSSAEASFLDTIGLQVRILASSPFQVDNNLLVLDLVPDLRLSGNLEHPRLNGRIQTNKGTLMFQGKAFDITQCIIDFVNPYRIDPEINVEATATIRDSASKINYTITLVIKGTADRLDMKLTSSPAIEQNKILALILVGTTLDSDAPPTETPGAAFIAEYLTNRYAEQIGSMTGLDIIEMDSQSDSGEEVTNISIGKKISSRLILKYAIVTRKNLTLNQVIAEYLLLENLILIYSYRSDGVSSGDITWRIEFLPSW